MANDGQGSGGTQITDEEAGKVVAIDKIEDTSKLTPEQVTQIVKDRDTLAAQKEHWRGKALDPETKRPWRDIAAEAKRVVPDKPNPETPPAMAEIKKTVEGLVTLEEKRAFGHQHGLSPEGTDNVFSYAQGRNIKPEDALKDDFVKSGLSALQARERLARGTPGPSNRRATVGGKGISELKPDERRQNWAKMTGAERT